MSRISRRPVLLSRKTVLLAALYAQLCRVANPDRRGNGVFLTELAECMPWICDVLGVQRSKVLRSQSFPDLSGWPLQRDLSVLDASADSLSCAPQIQISTA